MTFLLFSILNHLEEKILRVLDCDEHFSPLILHLLDLRIRINFINSPNGKLICHHNKDRHNLSTRQRHSIYYASTTADKVIEGSTKSSIKARYHVKIKIKLEFYFIFLNHKHHSKTLTYQKYREVRCARVQCKQYTQVTANNIFMQ